MKSSLASRPTGPRFGRLALMGGGFLTRGILACGMLTLVGLARPATQALAQTDSQQTPMEVTTDTPEYCHQLADRVHTLEGTAGKPPREVAVLSVEGQKMCDQGQTRGGIMRLRKAILIMTHNDPPTGTVTGQH
jgi:hypothetical protein